MMSNGGDLSDDEQIINKKLIIRYKKQSENYANCHHLTKVELFNKNNQLVNYTLKVLILVTVSAQLKYQIML